MRVILSVFILSILGVTLMADDKDDKLAFPLKVTQLQGGFAGFTGFEYMIAPDGAWAVASIFNDKATPMSKGKLTAKELKGLAAILAKNEVAKLPAKSGREPGANPHTISIQYGKTKARLVGQMPPELDKNNPTGSVESRFAGIFLGVKGLLKVPKGK